MMIKKATRRASYLRVALIGPSGSGKTYTALRLARGLVGPSGKILVIDSERGSASLYADEPDCAGAFDVLELESFAPDKYTAALRLAAQERYDAVVVDSLSHAWAGRDGALELVDNARNRDRSGNGFAAWRNVTPLHNEMVDAILQAPHHIIATMRSKVEYVQEKDEKTGKTTIRKIGLQPIQRDGMEYEFTVVGDIDQDHVLSITKSRCSALADRVYRRPGADVAAVLLDWLSGAAADTPAPTPAPAPATASTATATAERKARYDALAAEFGEAVVKKTLKQWGCPSLAATTMTQLDELENYLTLNHKPTAAEPVEF